MTPATTTHITGTATLRPVILGVAVDLGVADDAMKVFRALATAWGGCHCLVFPGSLSAEDLEARFHAYELDSLWTWSEDHPLRELLRVRKLLWRGSGDWGPFGAGRYTNGLIPWQALQGTPQDVHGDHDPFLDWLLSDASASPFHEARLEEVPSASLTRSWNHAPSMILFLDRREPLHRVRAWNLRALSTSVVFVDDENGIREVDWERLLIWCLRPRGEDAGESRHVQVWDLRSEPEDSLHVRLADAARRAGTDLVRHSESHPPTLFRGVLRTDLNVHFNATIPYGAMQATVSLPNVPLVGRDSALGDHRTIAAEVSISTLSGQDPRLVARLPDNARFSDLLDYVTDSVVRVRRSTEGGFVAGVSAATSSITVHLHRKSEVFRRFFDVDGDGLVIGQSDVGLFQTHAAEMLGGAASGALTQPGLAAALMLLASRPGGVPLPRLREEILKNRGAWPSKLSQRTPGEYAEAVLRSFVGSGMVVALLKAKCTYCRATMQLDPDALSKTMLCDFCGQEIRLATVIGWGSPKWVFRLAGHLSQAQVQAMIPALATLGQPAHVVTVQGGIDCNELGLTLSVGSKTVEADIVAYLSNPTPVTAIGEVKSNNRIDINDVANLEWLQDKLSENGFDSLIAIATAKKSFGPEEVATLREHCERRAVIMDGWHAATPRLPLLLTGRDLFLPWSDNESISRWGRDSPTLAVHGTALESCKRNLGLDSWALQDGKVVLNWSNADAVPGGGI